MLAPMRSRKPLLACLLGVAIAVPALAQSGASVTQYPACPDPPPKLSQVEIEAAHASYRVGVEAYNRGDYQKALDNFREAFRRDCSKVALLNFISRAYEGLGQKAEAIHALEVYLQRNPKAEDAEDIQTRIKNLKAQLASSSSTATTTATAPTATVTATVTATATPTATATAAPTETAEVRGHGAAPWVVVGVGAAAAIAGGVLIGVGQGDVSASRVEMHVERERNAQLHTGGHYARRSKPRDAQLAWHDRDERRLGRRRRRSRGDRGRSDLALRRAHWPGEDRARAGRRARLRGFVARRQILIHELHTKLDQRFAKSSLNARASIFPARPLARTVSQTSCEVCALADGSTALGARSIPSSQRST